MGICSVDECDRPAKSRGWCGMHYQRWLKHGDPRRTTVASTIREAFDLRTERNEGGCLVWNGARLENGYGQQQFRGRVWLAHRIAWTLVNGEIPEGMYVNHVCWNRACVNVEHLNLSSPSENGSYQSGPPRNNTSGFRNVYWSKEKNCWYAGVVKGGKKYRKYGFKTAEDAAEYAEKLRQELNGEFAGKG